MRYGKCRKKVKCYKSDYGTENQYYKETRPTFLVKLHIGAKIFVQIYGFKTNKIVAIFLDKLTVFCTFETHKKTKILKYTLL